MKKYLSTIVLILVFLTGLSVLLYPVVSDYVNSKNQSKAIASFVERMDTMDTSVYDVLLKQAKEYNTNLINDVGRFALQGEKRDRYLSMLGSDGGAIGYVNIDSIDVSLPIYLGDSPAVLQRGIGTMPGSSLPIGGKGTHAVLTGHRGLPSSRLFTDLDQVAVGDVFVLHILNEVLTYQVDQIRIVEPQDLTELDILQDQDLCTLVTCTPYGINTHRMLVRGHRVKNSEVLNVGDTPVTADAIQVDTLQVAPIVAVPLLLLLLAGLFLGGKAKSQKRKKDKQKK